jgi:UDP-glucose:(heptosyl)LPS alpha-1,3-glucosyltransferase
MNLAFSLFNYFPFGGLECDFIAISLECLNRGHSIDVFTMSWNGDKPAGINIHLIPAQGISNHKRAVSFHSALQTDLNRHEHDLFVGFNKLPELDIYYAADTCYTNRIRRQRNFLSKLTPRYRLFSQFEEAVFSPESKTSIIYLAEQEKQNYQRMYHTQDGRFYYAPPGVDETRIRENLTTENRNQIRTELGLQEKDSCLLMIGSNFRTKGVDRSIEALASLPVSLRESTYLFVIGKGKPKEYMKFAEKRGIGQHVRFLGARDDVPRFLSGADFLLQPSINENTGNSIVEALVAGVPVLATETCGYAEHIRRAQAGKVVPCSPFEQNTMNSMLHELLVSEDRDTLIKHALDYSHKTDLSHRAQVVADLFEEICLKN